MLWQVLTRSGEMLTVIHQIHDGVRACVRTQGPLEDRLLSPLLFNVVVAAAIPVFLVCVIEDPVNLEEGVVVESSGLREMSSVRRVVRR